MVEQRAAQPAIVSRYADDPEMAELVSVFVNELPARAAAFSAAALEADVERLRGLAHQLKGSAAGYGFDPLGDVAGRIEAQILNGERDIAALRGEVDALLDLCKRASASR